MPLVIVLSSLSLGCRTDTADSSVTPESPAGIVYFQGIPSCADSFTDDQICDGEIKAIASSPTSWASDWYALGEIWLGSGDKALEYPCVYSLEEATEVAEDYVMGTSESVVEVQVGDPRWYVAMFKGTKDGLVQNRLRITKCGYFASHPLWEPGHGDRSVAWRTERAQPLYEFADQARSYMAQPTESTYLNYQIFAQGIASTDQEAEMRFCVLDATGYTEDDVYRHTVHQISFYLEQERAVRVEDNSVRSVVCDRSLGPVVF